MTDERPKTYSHPEAAVGNVPGLIAEVAALPDPTRSLLTHNERALIELCQRLARTLELKQPEAVAILTRAVEAHGPFGDDTRPEWWTPAVALLGKLINKVA